MLSPRKLLLVAVGWLLLHALVWVLVSNFEPSRHPFKEVHTMFMYWDSAHYNSIVVRGYYTSVLWAFYPLYPLLLRGFGSITGLQDRPEIAGLIFSTLAFAAFCLLLARLLKTRDELWGLKPQSIWGWLFFLFSPASWVFHSHHTESLFLLLSFGALLTSRRRRWLVAAVLAGLCALTRNQGVVLAAAIALDSAGRREHWPERLAVFAVSGLISFLLFACYPAYQYVETGDALAFIHAQSYWHTVNSFKGFIGTLWFANPWQNLNWMSGLHHLFFLILNASAVGLWVRKKEFPIAFYLIVSLWLPLLSGHLENAFRFGAVLFPALFFLGDNARRLPKPVRLVLLTGLICLNLIYTRKYALGEWAY